MGGPFSGMTPWTLHATWHAVEVIHSPESTAKAENNLRETTTPAGVLRYFDVGDGPPLLFLHGSGPGVTGWRNFRGVLPAFAEQFRCLILEFPGFGVSDDFGGHPMVTAQGAVKHPFLDALGVDRVDIIGNSMGGGVGINFAINQPRPHPQAGDHRRHRRQYLQPRAQRGHSASAGVHRGTHASASSTGLVRWFTTRGW